MPRETIKQILIRRDNFTVQEADNLITEAREELEYLLEDGNICDAENICMDYFGLEPDYLDELY